MPGFADINVGGVPAVTTTALTTYLQCASKTGSVGGFTVYSVSAAANIIMLLDQTATPTAAAVTPIDFYYMAIGSTTPQVLTVSYAGYPLQFSKGLWITASTVVTTPYTITLGSASFAISAQINLA